MKWLYSEEDVDATLEDFTSMMDYICPRCPNGTIEEICLDELLETWVMTCTHCGFSIQHQHLPDAP